MNTVRKTGEPSCLFNRRHTSSGDLGLNNLAQNIRKIACDRRGNFGLIFGLTLPVLIMAAGLAVNFSNMLNTKTALQNASDAAALAAASKPNISDAERKKIAARMFKANAEANGLKGATPTILLANGDVTVTGSYDLDPVLPLLGGKTKIATPAVVGYSPASPNTTPAKNESTGTLDVALCIDATSSMSSTLFRVNAAANTLPEDLKARLKEKKLQPFLRTRIRAMYYRDIKYSNSDDLTDFPGTHSQLHYSNFFDINNRSQLNAYKNFVTSVKAEGGGDPPESGNECIYSAMRSQWTRKGDIVNDKSGKPVKVTQTTSLIILLSDITPHPLNDTESRQSPENPVGMPTNAKDWKAIWDSPNTLDQSGKKQISIYADCQYHGYFNPYGWYEALSLDRSTCAGDLRQGVKNIAETIANTAADAFKDEKEVKASKAITPYLKR